MSDRTCTVPGCDRPRRYREWCAAHYKRLREWPECSVLDCHGKGFTRGMCNAHYERQRRTGDLGDAPILRWHGEDIGYGSAHDRVKRTRGSARDFTCRCGAPATDWAYDHQDPNEKWGDNHGYLCPYSPDPAFYVPLCKTCHRRQDSPKNRSA